MNVTIPSYPRKRVSSGLLLRPDSLLDSCFRRNDKEEGVRTQIDMKSICFGTLAFKAREDSVTEPKPFTPFEIKPCIEAA